MLSITAKYSSLVPHPPWYLSLRFKRTCDAFEYAPKTESVDANVEDRHLVRLDN
jgi:hypothetical protein